MKTIMKSILSAFALTMFVVSTSFAQGTGSVQDGTETYSHDQDGMETQDTQNQLDQTENEQNEDKTQIAQEELPHEVSTAINEGEYAEYTVAETYEVKSENGEKEYEIHFETPEGQTEKETFNESGEVAR